MKITKHEHACLDIEEQGQHLIVDPGIYSPSLTDFSNVACVVITHVHADHLDINKLRAVYAQNPGVEMYAPQQVLDEVKGAVPMITVTNGDKKEVGPFQLEFFGTDHAIIHESTPFFQNCGVMVNNTLYYPGDSFTIPHVPVNVLALPSGAPWLKISEAMDFLTALKPKQVFPTHNAVLSDMGNEFHNGRLAATAKDVGAIYTVLKTGDALSI